jgi:hypothetical protein
MLQYVCRSLVLSALEDNVDEQGIAGVRMRKQTSIHEVQIVKLELQTFSQIAAHQARI